MVKKPKVIEQMDGMALDAVRAQLERVPSIQITGARQEPRLAPGYQLDAWIDFDHD